MTRRTPWARIGDAYDRSRGGRRLEGRLHRAMLDTTPARWRLGQALVALPLAALATAALGPLLGLLIASGAVRTGARVMLRGRSGRRAAALERAAPLLARSLGAELAAGAVRRRHSPPPRPRFPATTASSVPSWQPPSSTPRSARLRAGRLRPLRPASRTAAAG